MPDHGYEVGGPEAEDRGDTATLTIVSGLSVEEFESRGGIEAFVAEMRAAFAAAGVEEDIVNAISAANISVESIEGRQAEAFKAQRDALSIIFNKGFEELPSPYGENVTTNLRRFKKDAENGGDPTIVNLFEAFWVESYRGQVDQDVPEGATGVPIATFIETNRAFLRKPR